MDCRREMERVQIAQNDERRDVWEQLLSLQLPPQKEVLDCVEIICQSGEAKEKSQEKKNAQEEKRADAIQMELKNRQDTNHLFELLKKTGEQLEILKGQESKAEEMRKQIHAAIRAEKAAAAEEQLQKTKAECANLKKESQELEEKLKQQAKDLESAGALYQEREALSKKEEPKIQEQILRIQEILPKLKQVHSLKEQYQKSEQDMQDCMKKMSGKPHRDMSGYIRNTLKNRRAFLQESCRRENPVRCAVPAVIRKKRCYPEAHQKKSRWSVQKQCGIRQKKSVQKFWNGFRQ